MAGRLGQLVDTIICFFFPSRCLGCGRTEGFLCQKCRSRLPRIVPPVCSKCGRPQSAGTMCATCWSWNSNIDGIRSPFYFEGVVRRSVHELKYYGLKASARGLAELLATYLSGSSIPVDVLVPVPLHRNKLRQRGYNQSELLAKALGKLSSIPVNTKTLMRTKDSLPQTRAVKVDVRRANVQRAFCCNDRQLAGKQVLLIDDVCTSCSTLDACASALKEAGAVTVWGLTLARET